ncbi:4178_t:CDS:2 [Rhizophagus irregularis]|nr:4178_t:CDS:2 [Rhizophagus irregularis]
MKFYGILSKEYYDAFKSSEFYDIEILVGKKPDIKKFKYIYGGNIDVYKNDVKTNISLLVAADELRLYCLNGVIIPHLFKDQELLRQNFVLIQHVITKHTQFPRLTQFYKTTIKQDPSIIFKTGDFVTIEKDVLLNLVKNNTSFKQIDVWGKLIEWAIAQSRELSSDTTKWTKDNITTFGNLIQPFIPHIKFEEISPKDFSQKIKPFKNFGANHSDLRLLKNNTNEGQCYNNSYEKLIRRRAGTFEIDDYEVFQVKMKQ